MVRQAFRLAIANTGLVRNRIERRLTSKLALDADQRAKVHQILVRSQGQLKELRTKFQPELRIIISRAETAIGSILTPEQRAQFERLVAERHAVWQPPSE
jgi:Spy/CpxP family protein refolding chaperone